MNDLTPIPENQNIVPSSGSSSSSESISSGSASASPTDATVQGAVRVIIHSGLGGNLTPIPENPNPNIVTSSESSSSSESISSGSASASSTDANVQAAAQGNIHSGPAVHRLPIGISYDNKKYLSKNLVLPLIPELIDQMNAQLAIGDTAARENLKNQWDGLPLEKKQEVTLAALHAGNKELALFCLRPTGGIHPMDIFRISRFPRHSPVNIARFCEHFDPSSENAIAPNCAELLFMHPAVSDGDRTGVAVQFIALRMECGDALTYCLRHLTDANLVGFHRKTILEVAERILPPLEYGMTVKDNIMYHTFKKGPLSAFDRRMSMYEADDARNKQLAILEQVISDPKFALLLGIRTPEQKKAYLESKRISKDLNTDHFTLL